MSNDFDISRVMTPPMQAEGLPPAAYTDPDFLACEISEIFHKSWVGAGRAELYPNPGDYRALTVGGAPVLVLRDKVGTLRAFANTCRHRGMKLVEGAGNCRALKCPFHGWVYGLDGALKGAPHMERTEGFDKDTHGLVSVQIAERDGFVFVCLDPSALNFEEWWGNYTDIIAPWSPSDLRIARTVELDIACNWKLFVEVFMEYYHLPDVHAQSLAVVGYEAPEPCDATTGQVVTQFGTHPNKAALLGKDHGNDLPNIPSLTGRLTGGTRYNLVYPSMPMALSVDSFWYFEVEPLGVDRTRAIYHNGFHKDAFAHPEFDDRAAAYFRRWDTAIAEDIVILERQQQGLTSPLASAGRFSYLEEIVPMFGRWVAERVGGKPDPAIAAAE